MIKSSTRGVSEFVHTSTDFNPLINFFIQFILLNIIKKVQPNVV